MGQFIYEFPQASTTTAFTYVATGAEGNTLVVPALTGKNILLITYNTLTLIPETPPPDAQGYSFSGDTIKFGIPLNAGDVIQILYS